MLMENFKSHSREETVALGEQFGRSLKKGSIIAMKGGLGAGKTAFTAGIAIGLGIPENYVCSPTFSIVNEYTFGDVTMYHFDMYRVMNEESLESTGFFDYPLDEAVTVIEWSENIEKYLPKNIITVTIDTVGENERIINIT